MTSEVSSCLAVRERAVACPVVRSYTLVDGKELVAQPSTVIIRCIHKVNMRVSQVAPSGSQVLSPTAGVEKF